MQAKNHIMVQARTIDILLDDCLLLQGLEMEVRLRVLEVMSMQCTENNVERDVHTQPV